MRVPAIARWALLIATDIVALIVFKNAGSKLDATDGLQAIIVQGIHSPWVAAGLALYLVTFMLWMTILRDDDMSRAFPMTAIASVAAVVVGVTVFHEAISLLGALGVALIFAGVALLAGDRRT